MGLILGSGGLRGQLQLLIEDLLADVLERLVNQRVLEAASYASKADVGLQSAPRPVERGALVLRVDLLKAKQRVETGRDRHLSVEVGEDGVPKLRQHVGMRRERQPGSGEVNEPANVGAQLWYSWK